MDLDTYVLSKNNYQNSATAAFSNLRHETDFTDVTLACPGDKQIAAHKVILSSCSPFFKNIFFKNRQKEPLIYLKGIFHRYLIKYSADSSLFTCFLQGPDLPPWVYVPWPDQVQQGRAWLLPPGSTGATGSDYPCSLSWSFPSMLYLYVHHKASPFRWRGLFMETWRMPEEGPQPGSRRGPEETRRRSFKESKRKMWRGKPGSYMSVKRRKNKSGQRNKRGIWGRSRSGRRGRKLIGNCWK